MAGVKLEPTGLTGGDGRSDILGGFYKVFESYTQTIDGTARSLFDYNTLGKRTYLIRIEVDRNNTGEFWDTSWSGILTWFDTGTNSSDVSELHLQGAGHSSNGRQIKARVKQNYNNANPNSCEFQIWDATGGSHTNKKVTVYVKRLG